MNERLNNIVERLLTGDGVLEEMAPLSTGERCYVALAAGRDELLPATYADPVEAWHRLGPDWQRAVCRWRGWPEEYSRPAALAAELRRVSAALDDAGVPHHGCPALHRPSGRVRWLADRYREARAPGVDSHDR